VVVTVAANGFPTYEQVVELPAELETVVPREFEDAYGHMNVRHYFELNNSAVASMLGRLGLDDDYVRTKRCGMFTVEHHITYCSEVLVGDPVSSHVRLAARSPRSIRGAAMMVDHATRRLVNVFEFALVHVDLDSRKAVPYGAGIAAAADAELELGRKLDWPVPTTGAMGVRAG
jgi:acyl-CoA thioester hydrolase